MIEQLFAAFITMMIGVIGCIGYFYGSNLLLDVIFPTKSISGDNAIRNLRITTIIRPWLFMGPALIVLGIFLVYPVIESLRLSLHGRSGDDYVGMENYIWMLTDDEFHQAIFNNILWLSVVPAASTFLGLIIAVLTDRIWWGNIAKSLIFMPMAISFIGASVIWKFVYDYGGKDVDQIGLLNALVMYFGGSPQAWITLDFWNNFLLMVILIWTQTGFAMVILSAALRGIPEETLEAATIDGATGFQIFYRIMIPQIWGTIAVVWTTITILVLKVFDIVLAMTNSQWNTGVLANLMFDWMFRGGGDFGRGATIAVVIMIAVIPIMVWNIRRANNEAKEY